MAVGLFKKKGASVNRPGLRGPQEVHLCQGHHVGHHGLAGRHGLHLFQVVQVVLEALVDQEVPGGNIVFEEEDHNCPMIRRF